MGVAMGLSTYSNDSMEDVIAQGKGNPYAYQVTLVRDKQVVIDMIKRAESMSECSENAIYDWTDEKLTVHTQRPASKPCSSL
jgi:hypothetical protein